jgi:hypothetical protein
LVCEATVYTPSACADALGSHKGMGDTESYGGAGNESVGSDSALEQMERRNIRRSVIVADADQ